MSLLDYSRFSSIAYPSSSKTRKRKKAVDRSFRSDGERCIFSRGEMRGKRVALDRRKRKKPRQWSKERRTWIRMRMERKVRNEGKYGGERVDTDPHKGKLRIPSLCKTSCVLKSIFGSVFLLRSSI